VAVKKTHTRIQSKAIQRCMDKAQTTSIPQHVDKVHQQSQIK